MNKDLFTKLLAIFVVTFVSAFLAIALFFAMHKPPMHGAPIPPPPMAGPQQPAPEPNFGAKPPMGPQAVKPGEPQPAGPKELAGPKGPKGPKGPMGPEPAPMKH